MLKTSGSTESTTRPGKGGVGVGGDGGGDGGDDGGHDDEHSPRGSGRAHQQTHQLVRPGLWSSMMRLMEVGVVLLASRSKSRQKVEESSKSPKNLKGLKSCKGHRFGGTFTKAPILRQRTRASVRALTVFQAPQDLFQHHVWSNYRHSKAGRAADALSCFSPKEPGRSSSLSPAVTNGPFAPKFVCKTYVLPPHKFCRCAPEEIL